MRKVYAKTYFPFNHILSSLKSLLATMVVVVFKSLWFKVALMEELMGKIKFSSRLPQYFKTAILTGALQVTRIIPLMLFFPKEVIFFSTKVPQKIHLHYTFDIQHEHRQLRDTPLHGV